MGHTPFGYKIENGVAIINDTDANKVKKMYSLYLSGMSLNSIAKALEVKTSHAGIKRILLNKKYLGDDYYPQLIDKDTFDKIVIEMNSRATSLGRVNRQAVINEVTIATQFSIREIKEQFNNPFSNAEYIYSLIESERYNND